ncbi:hypothetical protein YC2023_022437 [Brassica napus]
MFFNKLISLYLGLKVRSLNLTQYILKGEGCQLRLKNQPIKINYSATSSLYSLSREYHLRFLFLFFPIKMVFLFIFLSLSVIQRFIPSARADHYRPSLVDGSIIKLDRYEVARCTNILGGAAGEIGTLSSPTLISRREKLISFAKR